MRILLF